VKADIVFIVYDSAVVSIILFFLCFILNLQTKILIKAIKSDKTIEISITLAKYTYCKLLDIHKLRVLVGVHERIERQDQIE
jgi:hypothetical protein